MVTNNSLNKACETLVVGTIGNTLGSNDQMCLGNSSNASGWQFAVRNTNTGSAGSAIAAVTSSSSSGNPQFQSIVNGGQSWYWGTDNNSSGKFTISNQQNMASNKFFTIDTSGNVSYATALTSFTPAITIGGSTTGITYTGQVAYYYQIGSIVYFNLHVVLSSKGAQVGNVKVTGFPTATGTHGTNNNVSVPILQNCTLTASYTGLVFQFDNSAASGTLYQNSPTLTLANLTNTQISNTFEFAMNGFYFTN